MTIGGVITDNEMAILRTWVPWSPPTDGTLEDSYARLGGLYQVAEEEIRRRLHARMAEPDSFSIPGDYSQQTGGSMAQLREALAQVEGLAARERIMAAGVDGPIMVGRLERRDSAGVVHPSR